MKRLLFIATISSFLITSCTDDYNDLPVSGSNGSKTTTSELGITPTNINSDTSGETGHVAATSAPIFEEIQIPQTRKILTSGETGHVAAQ